MHDRLMDEYFAQNYPGGVVTCPCLCFTALQPNSSVTLAVGKGSPSTPSLAYSVDKGSTWTDYSIGTKITLPYRGRKVFFKGVNNTLSSTSSVYFRFLLTGKVAASGALASLIDGTGDTETFSDNRKACFTYLFYNSGAALAAVDRLVVPYMPVSGDVFNNTFAGCSAIAATPVIKLPYSSYGCYRMFYQCTGLKRQSVTFPTVNQALGNNSYYEMFRGCTQLTGKCPDVPITTSQYGGCFSGAFYNCRFTEPPDVFLFNKASSLANGTFYGNRFSSFHLPVTSIGTTTNNLKEFFRNCINLNRIEVDFSAWSTGSGCLQDWVNGVASEGTFICPEALPAEYGNNRIPTGWTIVRK